MSIAKSYKLWTEFLKKGRKGGGGLPKVHMVIRGVIQKSTSVHKGGGGVKNGQKLVHMV